MNATAIELHIHLSRNGYVKPGEMHIITSYKDFQQLEKFFSSHFETLNYTHDKIGFPETLYRCPKGSVFLRDEKGELVRSPEENK